ncbi:hypothetical protein [Ammoniphilus sp. YIM 78166]|nr:hypothetical protein [Ammoniphilus sp. YIM 78166]
MKKGVLIILLCMIIAVGCSSQASTAGQAFGMEGFDKGKHAFFLFTSTY